MTARSTPPKAKMVKVRDAAGLLGITELAVRAAIRRRDIPAVRVGRQLLIPRAALEALLSPEGTTARSER
jgi:excisionase family DNA binding protein